jgi:NAD(P)-dependent dehydrogenase (short-subunit alcohol dehydrogenase family)
MQIVEDEGRVGQLKDEVIFITGCSSGIGVETARALHATGAHLFITARDLAKGAKVVEELLADGGAEQGKIDLLKLELDSLQSVRECAAEFLSKSKQLNILINNAGTVEVSASRG